MAWVPFDVWLAAWEGSLWDEYDRQEARGWHQDDPGRDADMAAERARDAERRARYQRTREAKSGHDQGRTAALGRP